MNLEDIREAKRVLIEKVHKLNFEMDVYLREGKDLEWINEIKRCTERYMELLEAQWNLKTNS